MGMTKVCEACGAVEPSIGTTNIAPGKVLVSKSSPMTKLSTSKLDGGSGKKADRKKSY